MIGHFTIQAFISKLVFKTQAGTVNAAEVTLEKEIDSNFDKERFSCHQTCTDVHATGP